MLLQVHDELVFEAKEAEVEKALKTVARVMEKAAEPAVRLKCRSTSTPRPPTTGKPRISGVIPGYARPSDA